MTDEQASAVVADIYAALKAAEAAHPHSRTLAILHGLLAGALEAYIADHPGTVRPYDGTDKPPPGGH